MSLPSSWRAGAAALLLVAPLALSACGSANTGVPASLAEPVGGGTPIGTAAAGSDGISTGVTFVGTVMTSDGFTLYRYTKDRATPPTSTCTGQCATSWPPVAAGPVPAPYTVDTTLLGTVVRPDGSKQLTVAGWPVYRYIKDTAPGFVNGQDVDGLWQAVGADGKPLTAPAEGAQTTSAPQNPAAAPQPKAKAPVAPAAKAAPAKAPVAPPKVVPSKAPVVATTTVVRDAPGTSSTD